MGLSEESIGDPRSLILAAQDIREAIDLQKRVNASRRMEGSQLGSITHRVKSKAH